MGRPSALSASDKTPSGMEYEIRVEKTVWPPRMTLHTKLVRRYRAEQLAATRVYTSGLMRKWMFDGFLWVWPGPWPKTLQVSRKSAALFGQGTIPEPSTPHIGKEVALVARTAAFVYI